MDKNHRLCSSCGSEFKDWKNQQNEGAYCKKCIIAMIRKIIGEIHKSVDLLCTVLTPEEQEKFRALKLWQKNIMVQSAFELGHLQYVFEPKDKIRMS